MPLRVYTCVCVCVCVRVCICMYVCVCVCVLGGGESRWCLYLCLYDFASIVFYCLLLLYVHMHNQFCLFMLVVYDYGFIANGETFFFFLFFQSLCIVFVIGCL